MATAIVDDPPDAASFSAHVMLGGKVAGDDAYPVTDGPVVRLNLILQPMLAGDEWTLPTQSSKASLDIDEFGKLVLPQRTRRSSSYIHCTARGRPTTY